LGSFENLKRLFGSFGSLKRFFGSFGSLKRLFGGIGSLKIIVGSIESLKRLAGRLKNSKTLGCWNYLIFLTSNQASFKPYQHANQSPSFIKPLIPSPKDDK
jgi:hypothetical protein